MAVTIALKDAYKAFTYDQDKIFAPEDTVRRLKERLRELELDILEETLRIDNGRLDIPIYFSSCGKDAVAAIGTNKQMGKGGTPQQSEASAVMELAERYSFFSFIKNPDNFFTARYCDLESGIIPFEMIARSVHDDSPELDVSRRIFERIPLKWTKAYNLTRGEEVLIPFDWFYAINEFNGPSAGNCQEEAISQGVCEVIERHTSSLVSQNRLHVPGIRIESATDPLVVEMIGKYRRIGVELYLSDFSLDTGIPNVGVMAYDPSTFPERSEIVWTAGTTPDPQKALSRGLTEVAQLAGDFNTGSNYVASGLPKYIDLEDAGYITHPQAYVDIMDLPDLSDDNIKIEVENLLDALRKIDFEVILMNTMHPLLQVPAFYTIIPGAHFRERALGTSVAMFSAKLITEKLSPDAAIAALTEIDRMLPGRYYIRFYLGASHLACENPDLALQHLEAAINLDPTDQDTPSIYSYMGVCLKEMGQYRKALEVLEKGEACDQERTDIHNLKGFCYFKLGDYEKAIESFERVIRLDPSSAIDYANIASNYRDLGNTERAIYYYQTALAIDETIDFARENLEKLRAADP